MESELSDEVSRASSSQGNHMARTQKRWDDIPSELATPADERDVERFGTDSVHQPVDPRYYMSPGQLYSTDSGSLFHAGKILIALVGLPATSKTLLAVAITRYTRWLGVRTKSFHVSEYRNKTEDGVDSSCSSTGLEFERKCVHLAVDDMKKFFQESRGQIATYDALNIQKKDRQELVRIFRDQDVKVLFIESIMTDQGLIDDNIQVALNSKKYINWDKQRAIDDYTTKLSVNESVYEQMTPEENLVYLKFVNFGEKIVINDNQYGYLVNKIVFFLMNLKSKKSRVYLARCGTSNSDKYIDDELLNEEGIAYSKKITDIIINRIRDRRGCTEGEFDPKKVMVWAGPRKRTYDTGMFFQQRGVFVVGRSQLKQLHPGAIADLTEEQVKKRYPKEYHDSLKDLYHFRFPRAESYHDLAVRMESLLMELEHTDKDVVIIAHESVLRVLYGYLLACTVPDVPKLEFTRGEITEVTFGPFCNTVERIPVPLDHK
ncbi:bifunctional fructose-2,6-bisphosphate 2-phosphatase/6-phosphofructo-2-kinase KNAG_0B05710 [Huiozyma naganishii CBS 8797]|uniref:6-phosphofructo-2-kinase domain-containing protein n=1 Tax=Huiozyma naganishii (strain ATCC MYA-139 / BCRC 22969 / CBS 8797 / KCTC 17520 / NBRC 10181 / NCYC 3082 / Yp74L-3) TaxID=1071383 RepID=J7RHJ1_HUIN7|nr:hypothetical protein KNAG_0B05710 [Kazachstania naganishii CBS 8797]CCK69003.1 hypothetical protein KNAG_0B05710 [Kazachstania naganishii CBS 8797]